MGRRRRYSASDETTAARGGTVGERIVVARMVLSADEHARISQEALGARVAQHLNDPRPITGATVSRWETGESVPDLETLAAIGAVCRVDPGWIAFGAASNAADPRDVMMKGGLIGQARAQSIRGRVLEDRISQLSDEAERNRKAVDERLEGFEKAAELIDQIEDSDVREARLVEHRAEFAEFVAADRERNAEWERRWRATVSQPVRKLVRDSRNLAKLLQASADAERRASPEPDDADQEVRRTSEPEPKTRSKAKARRS